MHNKDIVTGFEKGAICLPGGAERPFADEAWNEHPAFKGVFLKHLVTGEATEGALSCHMVRVEPGCCLESHIHEGQWELHEVINGQGEAIVDDVAVAYQTGVMAVIPKGVRHRVQAGEAGLVLLAKFFPALM